MEHALLVHEDRFHKTSFVLSAWAVVEVSCTSPSVAMHCCEDTGPALVFVYHHLYEHIKFARLAAHKFYSILELECTFVLT